MRKSIRENTKEEYAFDGPKNIDGISIWRAGCAQWNFKMIPQSIFLPGSSHFPFY